MPQGTIKSYDPAARTAVLLDDALVELQVGPEALAGSDLRSLRIGQRVRYELDDAGDGPRRVTKLGIVSL